MRCKRYKKTCPLFVNARILPEDMLYYEPTAILLHSIHIKNTTANLLDLFSRADSVHLYN